MHRLFLAFAALLLALPMPASAQVRLSFQSFNGSVLVGRYPHTFIVLEGTLDETGQPVSENYGYTAVSVTPAILTDNVAGTVRSEPQKYVLSTNRHFTVPISDAHYHAIIAEVHAWRDAPGKAYNLATHNCVHFVARIAAMVGLNADVPQDMVRRPKAWLNYVSRLNPSLGAREIR
jgi:hypothetical protein